MEKFTFGRYKGEDVMDVIRENPRYVRWASKNVSFFVLTDEQRKELDDNALR